MAAPALVVRVAANLSELKQNLKEGESALVQIGNAATGTKEKTHSLSSTYKQFDDVLRAAGINIGPQVRALDDIAKAAGGGASKIGMLGSAGLALGVGMAAWGITRAAMEFAGLDKHIESAWKTLLGFKDSGALAAANQMETLARASVIAGRDITNMAEAVRIIGAEVKRAGLAKIDWRDRLSDAQREVRNLTEAQKQEIEIAQRAGATTEELTAKYGISALGLKELAKAQDAAAEATERHRKRQEELIKNFDDARSNAMKRMHEQEAADMEAAMRRRIANEEGVRRMEAEFHQMQMKELDERVASEAAAEAQRIAANQAEIDGLLAAGQAHFQSGVVAKQATDQTIAGYAGIAQQVTITGDAVKEWLQLMRYTAQASAILQGGSSLFTTQSQRERLAALPTPRVAGGPVSQGSPYLVGERGPELFVPERSGTIVPNGAAGATYHITTHINVDGSILSTAAQLRDAVSGAIVDVFRSGATPMPANV